MLLSTTPGSYITKKTKAAYPSIQTLRIDYKIGKNGAMTTTGIAGSCTVENLDEYRNATTEEIINFLEMELNAYKRDYNFFKTTKQKMEG